MRTELALDILKVVLLAALYLFFRASCGPCGPKCAPTAGRPPATSSRSARRRVPRPCPSSARRPRAGAAASGASSSSNRRPARHIVRLERCHSEITIGREPGCTLMIEGDTFVSQRHARIYVVDGQPMVEDLGSTNGSFHNGNRLHGPGCSTPATGCRSATRCWRRSERSLRSPATPMLPAQLAGRSLAALHVRGGPMTSQLRWGAVTDPGRIRQQNEDSVLVDSTIFVVADGMGGHKAGEVASALTVQLLKRRLEPTSTAISLDDVLAAVVEANNEIFEAATTNVDHQGMGTTLTGLFVVRPPAPTTPKGTAPRQRRRPIRPHQRRRLTHLPVAPRATARQRLRGTVDHNYVQELVIPGTSPTTRPDAPPPQHRHPCTRHRPVGARRRVDAADRAWRPLRRLFRRPVRRGPRHRDPPDPHDRRRSPGCSGRARCRRQPPRRSRQRVGDRRRRRRRRRPSRRRRGARHRAGVAAGACGRYVGGDRPDLDRTGDVRGSRRPRQRPGRPCDHAVGRHAGDHRRGAGHAAAEEEAACRRVPALGARPRHPRHGLRHRRRLRAPATG